MPSFNPATPTPRPTEDILFIKGSITREKRMGDKTDPYLTPLSRINDWDRELFTFTAQVGAEHQLYSRRQHLPLTPAWTIIMVEKDTVFDRIECFFKIICTEIESVTILLVML